MRCARLIEGQVDQGTQIFLSEEQVATGFVLLCQAWSRYVSVGSVLAALALPPLTYVAGSPRAAIAAACAASTLIVFRHRANLARG